MKASNHGFCFEIVSSAMKSPSKTRLKHGSMDLKTVLLRACPHHEPTLVHHFLNNPSCPPFLSFNNPSPTHTRVTSLARAVPAAASVDMWNRGGGQQGGNRRAMADARPPQHQHHQRLPQHHRHRNIRDDGIALRVTLQ